VPPLIAIVLAYHHHITPHKIMKGIVGCFFEILVMAGIVCGIVLNATVVGSCKLLNVRGLGSFGPWREAITDRGNCQSWSKDQVNSGE